MVVAEGTETELQAIAGRLAALGAARGRAIAHPRLGGRLRPTGVGRRPDGLAGRVGQEPPPEMGVFPAVRGRHARGVLQVLVHRESRVADNKHLAVAEAHHRGRRALVVGRDPEGDLAEIVGAADRPASVAHQVVLVACMFRQVASNVRSPRADFRPLPPTVRGTAGPEGANPRNRGPATAH